MAYSSPQKGRITSGFSTSRRHPVTGKYMPHLGTDVGTDGKPSPVYSFGGGTVVAVGWNVLKGRTGQGIIIQHSPTLRSYYGHLSNFAVRRGAKVVAGQRIGTSGKTGNVTGVHLHFELHVKVGRAWVARNPQVLDGQYGVTVGTAPRKASAPVSNSGKANLKVDGLFGPTTIKALQRALGVRADGDFGPLTKKALEKRLKVTQNGMLTAADVRHLQRYLNSKGNKVLVDGKWGRYTTRAIQSTLNRGAF